MRLFALGIAAASLGAAASARAQARHINWESQQWSRDPRNPVIVGDGLAIHHVADPTVVIDGSIFRMWFGFVGEETERAHIGYAVSIDGSTWTVHPTAVLSPGPFGQWDDQKTEIPSVLIDDTDPDPSRRYKMWYGGAHHDSSNLTRIGFATSPDGISWTRVPSSDTPFAEDGLVLVPGETGAGDYAVVAEPTVLQRDGVFQMWYSAWGDNALVISLATSPDGVLWSKSEHNPVLAPSPGSWESGGLGVDGTVAQPAVVWDGKRYAMWYGAFDDRGLLTYRGIGFATSQDGIVWSKAPEPVVTSSGCPGEEIGIGTGMSVAVDRQGVAHLWYGSVRDGFSRVVGHATLDGKHRSRRRR